ncbi:MAG: Rubrerythrin [candidate division Zixibacteria bacterium SM23_81]|nr:MAG: Rubrerythrin [candidate division Zixibacteria bacterium SM23_81]
MELSNYSVEDLMLTALKSEIEAKVAYSQLAEGVENFILKERLNFLAGEEEKHRRFFERLYKKSFPHKEMTLPQESPVPLPQIQIDAENMPLSEILESAMEAELAAHDFYNRLADRYDQQPDVKKMLLYIASMELGHYKILEIERDNAKKFEDYDSQWPMMHVGP